MRSPASPAEISAQTSSKMLLSSDSVLLNGKPKCPLGKPQSTEKMSVAAC